MKDSESIEQLRELLAKAVVHRDIILSSGEKSSFYIDCRKVSLSRTGCYWLGRAIVETMNQLEQQTGNSVYVVAGEGVGGSSMAFAALACDEDLINNVLVVRSQPKSHGASKGSQVEGSNYVPKGTRVTLLEDVVTSGESVCKAAEALMSEGYIVSSVIVLLERSKDYINKIKSLDNNIKCYSILGSANKFINSHANLEGK